MPFEWIWFDAGKKAIAKALAYEQQSKVEEMKFNTENSEAHSETYDIEYYEAVSS